MKLRFANEILPVKWKPEHFCIIAVDEIKRGQKVMLVQGFDDTEDPENDGLVIYAFKPTPDSQIIELSFDTEFNRNFMKIVDMFD